MSNFSDTSSADHNHNPTDDIPLPHVGRDHYLDIYRLVSRIGPACQSSGFSVQNSYQKAMTDFITVGLHAQWLETAIVQGQKTYRQSRSMSTYPTMSDDEMEELWALVQEAQYHIAWTGWFHVQHMYFKCSVPTDAEEEAEEANTTTAITLLSEDWFEDRQFRDSDHCLLFNTCCHDILEKMSEDIWSLRHRVDEACRIGARRKVQLLRLRREARTGAAKDVKILKSGDMATVPQKSGNESTHKLKAVILKMLEHDDDVVIKHDYGALLGNSESKLHQVAPSSLRWKTMEIVDDEHQHDNAGGVYRVLALTVALVLPWQVCLWLDKAITAFSVAS